METKSSVNELCFRPLAGFDRVFEPGCNVQKPAKKHSCADCHFCQFCGDDRCQTCRNSRNGPNSVSCRKLSLSEQILLYEKINAGK